MSAKIIQIEEERQSYTLGAYENVSDGSVIAVNYKPTPDRLEQMTEHDEVKKKEKE